MAETNDDKPERLFAFRVTGRFSQVHYVRARSVKAARARWNEGYTDECDEFIPIRSSAKRLPELDVDGPSNQPHFRIVET